MTDKSLIQDFDSATLTKMAELFSSIRVILDDAIERAERDYKGNAREQGDMCEFALHKYLSETLGKRYTAQRNAVVFDDMGNESGQQDIVIIDDYWTSRLIPRDDPAQARIPAESIYAAIEVKKTLSSKAMTEALDTLVSIKELRRASTPPNQITPNRRIGGIPSPMFGQANECNGEHKNPYFTAIFAFGANRSLATVLKQIIKETAVIAPEFWPDVVAIHKCGVILPYCYETGKTYSRISDVLNLGYVPGYALDEITNVYSLLGFHLLLGSHLHKSILKITDPGYLYAQMVSVTRTAQNNDIRTIEYSTV